ncbi:uncharacterized protein RAG0_14605 [Rhynchosporium agropyri]|uniref:Uncharacterized protein n=1 Tax=Rhynchosporium agropyri TaxID=914238 RepID=A0A1E1LHM3_9HELO|nr:uncharacterized protein RAG0_14605 [Rhynchosporium agropyri]
MNLGPGICPSPYITFSVDALSVKHTNGYNLLYYSPPVSRSGLSCLFFSSYLSSAIVIPPYRKDLSARISSTSNLSSSATSSISSYKLSYI